MCADRTLKRTSRKEGPVTGSPGASPVTGVMKLKSDGSNFIEFKDALKKYLMRKYGNFACFIDRGDYWVPPMRIPSEDDPTYEGYTEDELAVAKTTALQERQKLIERHFEYRSEVFGILISLLYPEGEEVVMEETEYSQAEADGCPNTLWKLIKRTHANRMDNKSREEAKHEAFFRYTHCEQGNESVLQYRKRFDMAYENLVLLDHEYKPSEESKTRQFLMGLNKTQHNELLIDLANDERKGRRRNIPKTMSAAMARIKEFIPSSGKSDKTNINRGEPAVYSLSTDKRTCFKCGSDKHLLKKCPERNKKGDDDKKKTTEKQGVKFASAVCAIGDDSSDEDYAYF